MRPVMMLTTPSSGSTWLADVILATLPWARAHQKSAEFFQPLTNLSHYAVLRHSFGSENPDCMMQIATTPDPAKVAEAVEMFLSKDYTFAKEVFQLAHAPAFAEHFDLFMLYRSPADTFPPKRLRVLAWYDAIATAFETVRGARFTKDNLLARAIEAHEYVWNYVLLGYAKAMNIPVMDYGRITRGDEAVVEAELGKFFHGGDLAALVPAVMASRNPVERPA